MRETTTESTNTFFDSRHILKRFRKKRKTVAKVNSKLTERRIWSTSASNVDETYSTHRTATEEIVAFTNYKYRHPVETSRLDARQKQPTLNSASAGIHDKLLLSYRLDLLADIIYDGIYWSNSLEVIKPKGFTVEDDLSWISFINTSKVVGVSEGCGRMQNRLILFDNKSRSCARHRQNTDQIQGELFSFQLARILGIPNLVPSTVTFGKNANWNKVRKELQSAKWNDEKPVVLTKYIDDLIPAYIPTVFRSSRRRLHPVFEDIGSLNKSDLIELMQWSDLIIFDYLTANLDRVVNNLFNEQWNREMMKRPAHNLLRSRSSGLLLFIDNESGLLHGYRLLNEYETFHRSLLDSLCIFRKSTADSIESLHRNGNVSKLLKEAFYKNGVNYEKVAFLPESNIKMLKHRIATVYRQIELCKSLYAPSTRTLLS
ncbi:protein four-jointed-like protein [Leptotrombidium deliense]|uniref:Protein four-jointed-like protein n=1 Tax=Leptotrombidium deliense TaxID=299467 RepID=A0A443SIF1_9ACAR|nr:protein four-jointed-like protein [Leptotrombidium deliense]